MRASLGILSILLAGGIAGYLYRTQLRAPAEGAAIVARVDLIGIRSDLLSLAQAERRYLAANGRYAALEELRQAPELYALGSGRRGYRYDIEITADGFRISARPADTSLGPVLSIDETMRISVEDPQH